MPDLHSGGLRVQAPFATPYVSFLNPIYIQQLSFITYTLLPIKVLSGLTKLDSPSQEQESL